MILAVKRIFRIWRISKVIIRFLLAAERGIEMPSATQL